MYVLSQADKVRKMNECSYQKLQKKEQKQNKTKRSTFQGQIINNDTQSIIFFPQSSLFLLMDFNDTSLADIPHVHSHPGRRSRFFEAPSGHFHDHPSRRPWHDSSLHRWYSDLGPLLVPRWIESVAVARALFHAPEDHKLTSSQNQSDHLRVFPFRARSLCSVLPGLLSPLDHGDQQNCWTCEMNRSPRSGGRSLCGLQRVSGHGFRVDRGCRCYLIFDVVSNHHRQTLVRYPWRLVDLFGGL